MASGLHSNLRFAAPEVRVERRADGALLLRSPQVLKPQARAVGEWLIHWAARTPDHVFLADRAGDAWRRVTYAQALDAVRRIGQSLLDRGLSAEQPVAILSDNSVDHALLALGAMHVGVPVEPEVKRILAVVSGPIAANAASTRAVGVARSNASSGVAATPTASSAAANFAGSLVHTSPGRTSSKMYFSLAKSFDIRE